MTSHIARAAALATFAQTLDLAVDVIDDGRGGFVTRRAASAPERLGGVLLGRSVASARRTLRALAA